MLESLRRNRQMSYLDRAHLPPEEKLAALKSAYAEHLEPVKPDPMAEKLLQLDEELNYKTLLKI